MAKKPRKQYTAEEKVAILRERLVEEQEVSEVCEQHNSTRPSSTPGRSSSSRTASPPSSGRTSGLRRGQGPSDRRPPKEAGQQERGDRRTDGGERAVKKSQWGTLNGNWVPHDIRDQVVDYVNRWTKRAELPAKRLLGWLDLPRASSTTGRTATGRPTSTTARSHATGGWRSGRRMAILDYHRQHPDDGYRRLTYMMLDADVVGGQPGHRVPRAFAGRPARPTLGQALEEGHGLRSAPSAPRALAHRYQLPEHRRHVLLPHQHSRWLQPLYRPLGHRARG